MKWVKLGSLILMGLFYLSGGWNHFANPDAYKPLMPPYLPAHDLLIAVSGAAEIVLGLGLFIPATRRLAAWGVIALLVAVVPANIHVALYNVPMFGAAEGSGIWNWVRVAFQPVLMLWAWWYTRPDPGSGAAQEASPSAVSSSTTPTP